MEFLERIVGDRVERASERAGWAMCHLVNRMNVWRRSGGHHGGTLLFTAALLVLSSLCRDLPSAAEDREAVFQHKILPILQQRCYGCHSHSAAKLKGGLAGLEKRLVERR
jgi:hypothetical protein